MSMEKIIQIVAPTVPMDGMFFTTNKELFTIPVVLWVLVEDEEDGRREVQGWTADYDGGCCWPGATSNFLGYHSPRNPVGDWAKEIEEKLELNRRRHERAEARHHETE
jgi:hypothetical protein